VLSSAGNIYAANWLSQSSKIRSPYILSRPAKRAVEARKSGIDALESISGRTCSRVCQQCRGFGLRSKALTISLFP